jgi:anti-sigma factor RsiW
MTATWTDSTELTCQELVELVTDYLEDALPAGTRTRFEAHLAECDGCMTYLDQMRRTIALTGRLRESDLTPAGRAALLALFRDWKAR